VTNDFFILAAPKSNAVRADWTKAKNPVKHIGCWRDPNHARGGERIGDLDLTLSKPPSAKSLVWTWYGELLATQEAVATLKMAGVTGFDVRPSILRIAGRGSSSELLQELIVTGWGGLAPAESGVRRLEHCSCCGLSVFSCFETANLLLDRAQWDGSDFFFVWPAPRFVFVTRKVIEVLERAAISGWCAEAPATVTCASQLTPGPLSQWLPPERVASLLRSADVRSAPYLE